MAVQTNRAIFHSSRPALPPGLSVRIIVAIQEESARKLQFRSRIASTCSFFSLALFLISLTFVGDGLVHSDFWQIAGLLFSDLSLIFAHAEAFLLSLAETFPAASFTLLLLPLFFHFTALTFRSRYAETGSAVASFHLNAAH